MPVSDRNMAAIKMIFFMVELISSFPIVIQTTEGRKDLESTHLTHTRFFASL